jgi:hypothetical protein
MDKAELEAKAAVLQKMNRLWRDTSARRAFEKEAGLEPILSGDGLEVEAQHQSGQTEEYHRRFQDWADAQEG